MFKLPLKQYLIGCASLVTSSKSFKDNPIIGNYWLNRMGLHVFRVVLAHAIMHSRWWLIRCWASKADRDAFHRHGFLLKPNFLSDELFNALNQEIRQVDEPVRECIQGDTLTLRIFLDDETLERYPICQKIVQGDRLLNLIRYCSATLSRPLMYVQSIKNHFITGADDPQKTLHSDTFHPTVKAWLFLDDVSEINGPFTYAKGSQLLSFKRLKWEYKQSLMASKNSNQYSAKGSFRVDNDAIKAMNLKPEALKVSANTLIIANTHGFHCRGVAEQKSSRLELWFYSRSNPFIPLPNIDHAFKRYLEQSYIRRMLAKNDELRGSKAVWHLVNNNKIHEQS